MKESNMSLKDKVDAIIEARKPGRFVIPGYDTNDVLNTLIRYIVELEQGVSEAQQLRVKVGILEAKIEAGSDGKFGTKDDKVTLTKAKKPAAKKAAAKKPAAKKTTKRSTKKST
jgi:cell division septum initiation protein DivIVA